MTPSTFLDAGPPRGRGCPREQCTQERGFDGTVPGLTATTVPGGQAVPRVPKFGRENLNKGGISEGEGKAP